MYPSQGVVHNFELDVIFSWLTLLHSIQYIFIATDAFHVKLRIYSRACKIKNILSKNLLKLQFVFVLQRNEIKTFHMYRL